MTTPTESFRAAKDGGYYYSYSGVSYEWASREAERLVKLGWFQNFERLAFLRDIMLRELKLVRH